MRKAILSFLLLLLSYFTYGQKSPFVYTTDVDHFWIAYDSVKTTDDTVKQLGFIQTLYLDKATAGLQDFGAMREHSASRHLTNILKYPKFWASVRPKTLEIKHQMAAFESLFRNFKLLYPKFRKPKIYFTIGVLNSGGTTSPGRILIGAEIACADKTVDASELSAWLQGVFKTNTSVVAMVAHELGHTQQSTETEGTNILAQCIQEGACDFIAELLYKPVLAPYMQYGKSQELQV